jgi:hypothetical protein
LIYVALDDGSRRNEGKIQRTRGKGRNIIKKGRKVMRTKHAKIFILLFFVFFYIFW